MTERPRWVYAINRLMLNQQLDLATLEERIAKVGKLSHSALSDCVTGATDAPRASTFVLIAKALQVDLVELFCTEQQSQLLRGDVTVLSHTIARLEQRLEELQAGHKSDAVEPRTTPDRESHPAAPSREKAGDHPRRKSHRRR